MPKHNRPTNRRKSFTRAAVTTGTMSAVVLGASPALAQGEWDAIAQCESGGQNIESHSTDSSASGYFQIIDGTWESAGGKEFAPRAIDATREQQAIVAQRIAERRGSLADWNASRGCWGDQISDAVPAATPAAPVAPRAVPAPKPAAVPKAQAANNYTVVEGDTLVEIGAKVGVSWQDIAAKNGLVSPYMIHAGDVLKVSEPAKQYVVEQGDWLSTIAPKLDTTTQELYEMNKEVIGDNPDLIFPGQVFFVGGLPLAKTPVRVEEEKVVEEKPKGNEEVVVQAVPQLAGAQAIITNNAGPVHARTQAAANAIFANVRGASLITMGGTRGSAVDPNGHPSGNAIDYMVMSDGALGDAIVSYHIAHWGELGVEYLIWEQRSLSSPNGAWKYMADRGSDTDNHMDHVHVNYNP